MCRFLWTTVLVLTVLVVAVAAASVADSGPTFPASHADRLGGASYSALFGHDQEVLSPKPQGSVVGRPSVVGPNMRVNAPQQPSPAGLLGRSETTIAASTDGMLLVAGWNDAEGFLNPPFGAGGGPPGLSGYAYSPDGGGHWIDGGAPPVIDDAVTRGDPWMDTNDAGTFYYANLAVDANTGDGLGIVVHRGSFLAGGLFSWWDAKLFDSPNAPNDFYDKEALVAGKGANADTAYVSLTNFKEICGQPQYGFGQIEVWRTHDGGDTWQGPAIAGPEAPDSVANCGNEGTLQQTSVPAIGPDGELYVSWTYGPIFNAAGIPAANSAIVVARSLDGGVNFDPPVKVADINSMIHNPPVAYNRSYILDHPRIVVFPSGVYRGRVFVVFYSSVAPVTASSAIPCPPSITGTCFPQTTTSTQVYMSYSDDKGLTWSAPAPITASIPGTGVKRFWPVVTVSPLGSKIDVIYYQSMETQATADPSDIECNIRTAGSAGNPQRRVGTDSSLIDTYRVQSLNGGLSFTTPVRVSDVTSNWCTVVSNIRPNFGDYIGSATSIKKTHPVWADGRNGMPDTFYASVLGVSK